MPDGQSFDAEIAARYMRGESTSEIAKALGLRPAAVIGRVREMNLRQPHVQVWQEEVPNETVAATPACDGPERCLAGRRRERKANSTAASKVALLASYEAEQDDSDDEGSNVVCRTDRPRGWLVTEEELNRMFAGGRYENVRLKSDEQTRYSGYLTAKRTSNPVVVAAARRAYHSN